MRVCVKLQLTDRGSETGSITREGHTGCGERSFALHAKNSLAQNSAYIAG